MKTTKKPGKRTRALPEARMSSSSSPGPTRRGRGQCKGDPQDRPAPSAAPLPGGGGHDVFAPQRGHAPPSGTSSPKRARALANSTRIPPAKENPSPSDGGQVLIGPHAANAPVAPVDLRDPVLGLLAASLDDLENVRKATHNRLRILRREEPDKDGETRGLGISDLDAALLAREGANIVAPLEALAGQLEAAEAGAVLELKRRLRKHPLHSWVKRQKGIGEKTVGRLLACIGDPYWRPEITREGGAVEPARPRVVSELWALCGMHVIDGQAPRRQKGQKSNWNSKARTVLFNMAVAIEKCSASPYRAVYDATRAKYADAVHTLPCARCGPAGKPALVGSPLSGKHQQARAYRAVSKEILKDLWLEARNSHLGGPGATERPPTTHVAPPSPEVFLSIPKERT